jgi:predicted dehydrogenase
MVLTERTMPRILVAGTGSIGRRHIGNLRHLRPHAKLALLRDAAGMDEYARSLGAEVFGSLDEALAWGPALAVVATPSDRHREVVAPLLRSGVACFLEKPVVIDVDGLAELEALASSSRLPPTQVGCVLRFLPSLRQVHAWLSAGAVGTVVRASLEVGQWLPDWRPTQDYRKSYSADAMRGGGVVLDLIHEIDLACWLFSGQTARRPQLLGAWGGRQSQLEITSEDVALLALRAGNGALLSVQLDYVARNPLRRLQVVGDAGTITWDLIQRSCRLQRPCVPAQEAEGFDTGRAYVDAMEELLLAVERGTPTSLPLHEALPATGLAIEANQRIRTSLTP